jgi:hypothetical protein
MSDQAESWIELRKDNKLWAKYCPEQKLLEIAKGKVKVTFDLKSYELAQLAFPQETPGAPG